MINQPYSYPLKRHYCPSPGKRWDRNHSHNKSFARRRAGAAEKKRLGLEWLEPRHLLAANPSSSSIAAVQPYNGEQLSQSPQDLVITFNGLNVPALMGSLDVQLEELNRDGTATPIWNFNNAPVEESDPTGTELIVPIQVLDATTFAYDNLNLSPGNYEIDLVGGTGLAYAASGAFGPGPQLWNPNQDHEIGTFTILGQGATLSSATPLGAIGANLQTELGSLDTDNPTNAVHLYKFTLPQGNFYQVGLEISAYGIGSPLLPALTLFDSNGNVLATRNSGMGIPSDPNDPYLFMGLAPGTYYVGVSGAGNLPNVSGGYDPVLGIPGTDGLSQQGGPLPYALSLVAAPHDQPTRLLDFTLDYGDSTQSSPTGVTLSFSGPINVSNLFVPDSQETALEVVDSSGQVWPITAESYVVTGNSLEMIFDSPLKSGSYTLYSSPSGGLVDLAGEPISGTGGTSGVLAHWTVAPGTAPRADNLGVLWPNSANANLLIDSGPFAETTVLGPEQTADFRWTVVVPGFYNLQTELNGGPVAVIEIGNGETVLDPGTTAPLNNYIMSLNDGVQTLRFVNESSQPVTIDWLIKIANLDWDKIIDNGVGQTFALTLGLTPSATGDSGSGASVNLAGVQAIATALSGSASNFAGSMGPVPATLVVTLNTGLIGQPTVGSQSVAAVGPSVAAGSTALTDSGNSLLSGIGYGSSIDWSEWLGDAENLAGALPGGPKAPPQDLAVARASTGARVNIEPEADGARADDQALGQAQWLVRLGARLQRWLTSEQGADRSTTQAAVPAIGANVVQNTLAGHQSEPNATGRKGRVSSAAHSDLGAIAGVILVGATACRLRRPLLSWWRMKSRPAAPGLKLARPHHPKPHASSIRARVTARPSKKAMR